MTLPIAKTVPGIRIIAFEPNRRTNRSLRETLRRNDITCAEVIDRAVCDTNGTATFAEVKFDTTGNTPWAPEGSAIVHTKLHHPDAISATYEVSTTTLDAFFANRDDACAVRAVKIDIESYEIFAVKGAASLLARVRPFIAIDIHRDLSGKGTTEPGVRACLETIGYRFEKDAHVLLCYPPG